MIPQLAHLVAQWLQLALVTFGVLALGGVTGWAALLWLAPPRYALRWVVFAPILGMALLSIGGLPLSLLGLPARVFAWPLSVALALAALMTLWQCRRHPLLRRHRLLAHVRARGWRLIGIAGIVTGVAAFLMTFRAQSDTRDFWGSTDFAPYWGVSDYLVHHGADADGYRAQTEFRSDDIRDHLQLHARLGCMVYLAELAAMLTPHATHQVITLTLVSSMVLLAWLCAVWLERVRCRPAWPSLALACHPFLYFLLFFTYVSQATGVVLLLAGFFVGADVPREGRRGAVMAGLLLGAALLHYPAMPPVIACFFAAIAIKHWRGLASDRQLQATLGVMIGALLLSSAYYFPAILRELTWLSSTASQCGWDWKRPISLSEFAGVGTVLAYDVPRPLSTIAWILEVMAGCFLLLGVVWFWRSGRDRIVVGALGASTAVMALSALRNVANHAPHATHSYVKIVSMFILLLMAACFASWDRWARRLASRPLRIILAALAAVWVLLALRAVRPGSFQEPRYRASLAELGHRQAHGGERLWFAPSLWLSEQLAAPIVRNVSLLAHDAASATIVIAPAGEPGPGEVVDRAGPYIARRVRTAVRP